jgi:hypothetical protein
MSACAALRSSDDATLSSRLWVVSELLKHRFKRRFNEKRKRSRMGEIKRGGAVRLRLRQRKEATCFRERLAVSEGGERGEKGGGVGGKGGGEKG